MIDRFAVSSLQFYQTLRKLRIFPKQKIRFSICFQFKTSTATAPRFMLGNITVSISNTRSFTSSLFVLFAKDKYLRYNGLKISIISSSLFLCLVKKCIEFLSLIGDRKFLLMHSLSNVSLISKMVK